MRARQVCYIDRSTRLGGLSHQRMGEETAWCASALATSGGAGRRGSLHATESPEGPHVLARYA